MCPQFRRRAHAFNTAVVTVSIWHTRTIFLISFISFSDDGTLQYHVRFVIGVSAKESRLERAGLFVLQKHLSRPNIK